MAICTECHKPIVEKNSPESKEKCSKCGKFCKNLPSDRSFSGIKTSQNPFGKRPKPGEV